MTKVVLATRATISRSRSLREISLACGELSGLDIVGQNEFPDAPDAEDGVTFAEIAVLKAIIPRGDDRPPGAGRLRGSPSISEAPPGLHALSWSGRRAPKGPAEFSPACCWPASVCSGGASGRGLRLCRLLVLPPMGDPRSRPAASPAGSPSDQGLAMTPSSFPRSKAGPA